MPTDCCAGVSDIAKISGGGQTRVGCGKHIEAGALAQRKAGHLLQVRVEKLRPLSTHARNADETREAAERHAAGARRELEERSADGRTKFGSHL